MVASIIDTIGNTPLVQFPFDPSLPLYAKLEYLNPGGSVKDRSAKFMIEYAEKHGILKPGGTLIEASSGNQGISVAMIGKIKGYNVIITASEKVSAEKLAAITAYGAHVVICPATSFVDDPQSAHSTAVRLQKETPNSFMPNQYLNPLNAQAHYTSLGPEIWQQTNGKITHFFASAGTGGTITGVGRFLKEKNPNIKIIAVDSINSFRSTNGNPKPYKLEGIGIDFVSPVIDYTVIDEVLTVSDDDAIAMLKKLAHKGFLVGPAAGAVAHVAYAYAKKHLTKNSCAVMIYGDSGRAYLSKGYYAEETPAIKKQTRSHKKPIEKNI